MPVFLPETTLVFCVAYFCLYTYFVAVLCLDKQGCIAAGVSTSGPPFKVPGRVGDSPLPGCGLYADNSVSIFCGLQN